MSGDMDMPNNETFPYWKLKADQDVLDEVKNDRASYDLKAAEWTINYAVANDQLKCLL